MAIFGGDKETQELLKELADRLSGSAKLLSDAARRLHLAELTYREYLVRLRKLDEQMRTLTDMLRSAPQIQPAAQAPAQAAQAPLRRLHRVLQLRGAEEIREDGRHHRRGMRGLRRRRDAATAARHRE